MKEEPVERRDDYLEAVSPERSLPADEPYSDAEPDDEGEEEEEDEARSDGSALEDEEEDEGEDLELEEGMGGLIETGSRDIFPNGFL